MVTLLLQFYDANKNIADQFWWRIGIQFFLAMLTYCVLVALVAMHTLEVATMGEFETGIAWYATGLVIQ